MLLKFSLLFFYILIAFPPQWGKAAWWERTTVYEVYPRSLQDSDGDGTGDLNGIRSRLDYFADLGVETLWLTPIFESPMRDNGYDISNYLMIDPLFGTMEDFQQLVVEAHQKGLKIVLDFVLNHSSDQHEWFQKSLLREHPYSDYYVWEDPKGFDDKGNPIPPTNWVSAFRGSMWEFREERQQFYLHQYLVEQPDLNYRNPLIIEEMKNVLQFWLDIGVDGFRLDAVVKLIEDDQLRDELPNEDTDETDEEDYSYWNHTYTTNLPETREILKEFHDFLIEYGNLVGRETVDMLEVNLDPTEQMKYYECGDFPFNFYLTNLDPPVSALATQKLILDWMDNMPEGTVANWVTGSHDFRRTASRLDPMLADALNMIALTLPGISVTYQGEEIGMADNMDITWEETVDNKGCNCGPELYLEPDCSRDPERTPMQWDDSANAGFSAAERTWLPVNENYVSLNVGEQRGTADSHLEIYRRLVALRGDLSPTGEFETFVDGEVLAFATVDDRSPTHVTVINFGGIEQLVDLSGVFHDAYDMGYVVVAGAGGHNSESSFVDLQSVFTQPKESFVMELVEL